MLYRESDLQNFFESRMWQQAVLSAIKDRMSTWTWNERKTLNLREVGKILGSRDLIQEFESFMESSVDMRSIGFLFNT